MNDFYISAAIAIIIMFAIPLIGKFIIEPYCKYCNNVLGLDEKEDR